MKPVLLLVLGILYFSLCFWILPYIPIAWIDEVMFADAAKNLAQTGNYFSRLWEQPKTEEFLIGHLPLWQLLLAIWYKIFPTDLFWTRVPGILLYIGFAILAWVYYKNSLSPEIAAVLTIACLGDKAIFEAARSVRMDMLGAVLFMAIAAGEKAKWSIYLRALFCGLLALVHPNFWPGAGILFFSLLMENKGHWRLFIPCLLPIVLYLIWIFPWIYLIEVQLVSNGADHINIDGSFLTKASDYFYLRYFRWYEIQQVLPLLYLYTLAASLILFPGVKQSRKWTILLFVQTLFLMLVMGNYPRYNLPVVLTVWILLPWLLLKIPGFSGGKKLPGIVLFSLIAFSFYPLLSRTAIALYQKEERKTEPVLAWLKKELPDNQKSLLIDEAVGYYLQQENIDFSLIHTKEKFNYSDYPGGIYWLTYFTDTVTGMKKVSEYYTNSKPLPSTIPARQTYKGLKLYKVETETAWKSLKP